MTLNVGTVKNSEHMTARPTVAAGKQEDQLHGYAAVLHRCVR